MSRSNKSTSGYLRHYITHSLVIIFGMSAWLGTNGIFVQLPLLTASAPEKWRLPLYLVIAIQSANIAPLVYIFLKKIVASINDAIGIILVLSCGVVSMGILSFSYNATGSVGGKEYSLFLFVGTFFTAIVGCTSSILFLPFLKNFNVKFLPSYFIGEGLSGVVPSILALIQGTGTSKCHIEPIFSPTVYFLMIFGILMTSLLTFFILNLKKRPDEEAYCSIINRHSKRDEEQVENARKTLQDGENSPKNELILENATGSLENYKDFMTNSQNSENSRRNELKPKNQRENRLKLKNSSRRLKRMENLDEHFIENLENGDDLRKTLRYTKNRQKNEETTENSHEKSWNFENSSVTEEDSKHSSQNGNWRNCENSKELLKNVFKLTKFRLIYLHILVAILCFLGNGFLPAIQTYSCLPYGRISYHLAVTLGHIANPLACIIYTCFRPKNCYFMKIIDGFSAISIILATAVTFFAIQLPISPFRDSISSKILLIITWISIGGLIAYVKLAIASVAQEKLGGRGLFSIGGVMQIGSAIGAISSLILINFFNIFEEIDECNLEK